MPMDLLRKIERAVLPLDLRNPQDIRSAAVLKAAGLIEAMVPEEPLECRSVGTVLRITPTGRAELARTAPQANREAARPVVGSTTSPSTPPQRSMP